MKEKVICSICKTPREIIRIKKEMSGKKFWCCDCHKSVEPLKKLNSNIKGDIKR